MAVNPEEVIAVARRYRERLIEMEARRARRMLEAWRDIERRLVLQAEVLAARIAAGGEMITPSLVLQHERYVALIAEARVEINRFSTLSAGVVAPDQAAAVELGLATAQTSLEMLGLFRLIPREAVAAFAEWTGADTMPLVKLFREAFPEAADAMTRALMTGIGAGLGPARIAAEMMQAFGVGFDRALLISRTEVMRAYRRGTQDSYRASEVVIGYKRLATHDGRVCLGCLFTEGMMFEEQHDFDAHPNCRCTLVPVVIGVDAPQWQAGQEWFLAQSETRQRELLGTTRWDLWKNGEVRDLRRFATHKHDPEWGGAFVPTSIRDLRAA